MNFKIDWKFTFKWYSPKKPVSSGLLFFKPKPNTFIGKLKANIKWFFRLAPPYEHPNY